MVIRGTNAGHPAFALDVLMFNVGDVERIVEQRERLLDSVGLEFAQIWPSSGRPSLRRNSGDDFVCLSFSVHCQVPCQMPCHGGRGGIIIELPARGGDE